MTAEKRQMPSKGKFEEFSGKYTQANFIGKWLINNFYGAVSSFVERVDLRSGAALEVGAGQGYSTRYLREALQTNVMLTASELEPTQVQQAQLRNPDVPITSESVYELQRADKSVDLIIMLEVLEHLENPEIALSEIARVASQFVILSVPREPIWCFLNFIRGKYWTSLGNTPGHINHWSTNKFRHFVGKYFEVVDTKTPLPWTIVLLRPRD